MRQFIEQTWEGRTSTVFAYGPSNSGKTHTMSGYAGDHGIIPRAVKVSSLCILTNRHLRLTTSLRARPFEQDLFATADEVRGSSDNIVSLRISFMEIWRDQCRDLMKDSVRGDKVRAPRRWTL